MYNKLKKLFYLILRFKNKKNYLDYQLNIYKKYNLNRVNGEKKLKKIKLENNFLDTGMISEHQVIFSSISNQNKNIKKILEIGTYDGKNAFLLSKLFPDAVITTIDLTDNDNIFKSSYQRENNLDFVKARNEVIEKSQNIKFKQLNSVNLIFEKEKYDLIWIDGAHGYPFVTIDIINSLRLSEKNALIVCDDVYKSKIVKPDEMYYSNASIETIKLLANQKIISYDLFLKRLGIKYNYFPQEQKFIAVIKKIKNDL